MHDQALGANIQTHIRAWTIRLFKTIMPPAHAPDASCANVSEHAEFVCEAAQCCPSSSVLGGADHQGACSASNNIAAAARRSALMRLKAFPSGFSKPNLA